MRKRTLWTSVLMGFSLLVVTAYTANANPPGTAGDADLAWLTGADAVGFADIGAVIFGKGGGKGGGGDATPTPEPTPLPEGCTSCPAMFVRSIVVGANKNPDGSTYATCRVVMWDEQGNEIEGATVLHEWSGAGSGQVVDDTAPNPPFATSTLITFNDGPKCKGRNPSQVYTCSVLDAVSANYTYVPASNWETSDSDEACTP